MIDGKQQVGTVIMHEEEKENATKDKVERALNEGVVQKTQERTEIEKRGK